MNLRDYSPATLIASAAGALLLIITLWWLVIGGPAHSRKVAAEARAGAIVAEGQAAAGRDAVAVITGQAGRDAATDKQTQENRDAILNAPGAAAAVDPGVDAAGRRAICLRHANRCQPSCVRLLGACPR